MIPIGANLITQVTTLVIAVAKSWKKDLVESLAEECNANPIIRAHARIPI